MSLNSLPTKGRITFNSLENLKKTYRNFYFVTITCNKHPQVHTVNEDIYNIILSRCGTKVKSCYELNNSGQLHMHSLNVSTKALYMKELLQQLKKDYPQYHVRIDKIPKIEEVNYCYSYIHKERSDVRPLYYRLAKFYQENKKEDFCDLADYGFEFNSNSNRFKFMESTKPTFED